MIWCSSAFIGGIDLRDPDTCVEWQGLEHEEPHTVRKSKITHTHCEFCRRSAALASNAVVRVLQLRDATSWGFLSLFIDLLGLPSAMTCPQHFYFPTQNLRDSSSPTETR